MTAREGHASVVALLLAAKADANQASNVRQNRDFKDFFNADNFYRRYYLYGSIWMKNDF
jgi:hypothetical protein